MKQSLETFSSFLRRFFSGTMISRISGLGRETVMATLFGASAAVANFWMAFRFAHLLRRFFAEGAMHVSFLPHFMQLRQKDPQEAAHFFYQVILWVTSLLLIILVCVDSVIGWLLLYGDLSEFLEQMFTFTLILSPSLIFITLYGLNSSFLHAENKFFSASVAPVAVNLVWMISAYLLAKSELFDALKGLSIAVVFGFALQFLLTLPPVLRFFATITPDRERAKRVRREIREMARPFFYAMIGVMATQINSALDMLFAKAADPEGPAYLWYALRLQQLPLGLIGVGLAAVVLPALSKRTTLQDRQEVIWFASSKAIVLMLPLTAAFVVMSSSIVQLLFGHGRFTALAHANTVSVLICYAMALLPMTLVLLLASWFYAKKETRNPAIAALYAMALNAFLNTLFVYVFHWGTISVALATSLSALFNLLYLVWLLRKEGVSFFSPLYPVLLKTTLCTGIAAYGTWQMKVLLLPNAFTTELFLQMKLFTIEAGTFSLLFLLSTFFFKLSEFTELFTSLFRRTISQNNS